MLVSLTVNVEAGSAAYYTLVALAKENGLTIEQMVQRLVDAHLADLKVQKHVQQAAQSPYNVED
ncbi:MAG TPA: hypothetical protein PLS49_00635 [Candidatus Woesebacteria bacterium]|nr:hypothetical protein [Candidatus Woesebacteria bacterium]